jgi:excisionase family DNA binding protein
MQREAWVGLDVAARRLGVSRSTLYRLLARGQLVTGRRGRTRVVAQRSIRALLLAHPQVKRFGRDHPIFRLIGKFPSRGKGPGSSDKYGALWGRR